MRFKSDNPINQQFLKVFFYQRIIRIKKIYLLLFFPFLSYAQIQIGNDIDGEAAFDTSGRTAFSSDGNVLAIGAISNDGNGTDSGHVRVFRNISNNWLQIGSDIDGEAAGDIFGSSVSLSSNGTILAVGAQSNDGNGSNSGHVRIYQNISDNWVQIGSDIDGEAPGDISGGSVSLSSDGTIVAIGAQYNDGNGSDSGHVRIYQNVSNTWAQIGTDINGEAIDDWSGLSVSLSSDGNVVAIGANNNDGNGSGSGHVRVYRNVSGNWIQVGADIDGEASNDRSGNNVSLSDDGTIVAIGAYNNDENGSNSGQARVYQNILGSWIQLGADINGIAVDDNNGFSVSLSSDGTVIAVGAILNNGNGSDSGQVRIYKNILGSWTQIGVNINGEAAGDWFGYSISLSSDASKIAIGAVLNDANGTNAGHVRVYDLSSTLSTENFLDENVTIFPNPSSQNITIILNEDFQLKRVDLYNSLGQLVKTETNSILYVNNLSKGIYFLEVITNKGQVQKTIVVE